MLKKMWSFPITSTSSVTTEAWSSYRSVCESAESDAIPTGRGEMEINDTVLKSKSPCCYSQGGRIFARCTVGLLFAAGRRDVFYPFDPYFHSG